MPLLSNYYGFLDSIQPLSIVKSDKNEKKKLAIGKGPNYWNGVETAGNWVKNGERIIGTPREKTGE